MKKTFLYEKKIIYYQDLIQDTEIINKINLLEETISISNWSTWMSSDSYMLYGKEKNINLNMYGAENNMIAKTIVSQISNAINFCKEDYYLENNLEDHFLPSSVPIRVYNSGTYMGPHIDTEDEFNFKFPTISMVLYLNDDFDGGEIEFINQGIKIKPSAGSLIVFPSTKPYYHSSLEIKSGNKYICPVFLYKNQV